uniref:Alternative protein n=1 Tax=Macrostomum lignano TaxID=282301 RepID=A0A1I8F827_9PLAT
MLLTGAVPPQMNSAFFVTPTWSSPRTRVRPPARRTRTTSGMQSAPQTATASRATCTGWAGSAHGQVPQQHQERRACASARSTAGAPRSRMCPAAGERQ